MPNHPNFLSVNDEAFVTNASELEVMRAALRHAIAKAINCVHLAKNGNDGAWKAAENELNPLERVFYEFAMKRRGLQCSANSNAEGENA